MCTEKENVAFAVFTLGIVCSVIEVILAATMMKISEATIKTTQLSPSHAAYYQVLFLHYFVRIVPFEVSKIKTQPNHGEYWILGL